MNILKIITGGWLVATAMMLTITLYSLLACVSVDHQHFLAQFYLRHPDYVRGMR